MKVGDKVNYVPDTCHALHANPTDHPEKGIVKGEYPWVIGTKGRNGEVAELTGDQLANKIAYLKRNRTSLAREGLELMHPKALWPAVVLAVNGDQVEVSIDAPNSAVNLQCSVKVDPTGKTPHTVHSAKAEIAARPTVEAPAAHSHATPAAQQGKK